MTAHATLQSIPTIYPNSITAKLLNSQLQAWEMMLSQSPMQLTLPIKEPAEDQSRETEVETSLVP